jgi:imidazolonepropionase-like amidohydrolase
MTPAEAITAATVNAAYAYSFGQEAARSSRTSSRIFVIHDCSDYSEIHYFFGRETARTVYLGGVRLAVES